MIKAPQRAELGAANFHYLTAITKAQIDGLIGAGVLHMHRFEETSAEVEGKEGERYGMRPNPARAQELAASARQTSDASNGGAARKNFLGRPAERTAGRIDSDTAKAMYCHVYLIEHAVSLANDGHAVVLGPTADEAGDGLLFPLSARKPPCGSRPAPEFQTDPLPAVRCR